MASMPDMPAVVQMQRRFTYPTPHGTFCENTGSFLVFPNPSDLGIAPDRQKQKLWVLHWSHSQGKRERESNYPDFPGNGWYKPSKGWFSMFSIGFTRAITFHNIPLEMNRSKLNPFRASDIGCCRYCTALPWTRSATMACRNDEPRFAFGYLRPSEAEGLRLKPSCDPSSCGHPSIWRLPAEKTQWKHDWQRLASFWLWQKFKAIAAHTRWSGELVARNQHLASEKWPWPMKLPLVRCQIQWVP